MTIDDALLDDTRRLLGTTGVSSTVNAALAAAARQARLAAFDVRLFDIRPASEMGPARRVAAMIRDGG